MAEVELAFNLSGPDITKTYYPINAVNSITSAVASLLDRQIRNALTANRVSHSQAEYQIRGTFPKHGSFEQQLIVFLKDFAANHPVVIASLGIIGSMNAVFSLYDHIKKRLPAKAQVKTISDRQIVLTGAGGTLAVERSVFEELVERHEYRQIMEQLSPNHVETLEFTDGTTTIKVTGSQEDKKVWHSLKGIGRQIKALERSQSLSVQQAYAGLSETISYEPPLEIIAKIRAVDLDRGTGRVEIGKGQAFAPGQYDFQLSSEGVGESLQYFVGGSVRAFITSVKKRSTDGPVLVLGRTERFGLAAAAPIN